MGTKWYVILLLNKGYNKLGVTINPRNVIKEVSARPEAGWIEGLFDMPCPKDMVVLIVNPGDANYAPLKISLNHLKESHKSIRDIVWLPITDGMKTLTIKDFLK